MEILVKAKDLLKRLINYDINSIIEEGKLKQFECDFKYTITKDGISIGAPSFFKILFRALRKDTEIVKDILSMMAPLLRDIPGGS